MTIMDIRPLLAVGVSLAAAVMIAFSGRWPNLRVLERGCVADKIRHYFNYGAGRFGRQCL